MATCIITFVNDVETSTSYENIFKVSFNDMIERRLTSGKTTIRKILGEDAYNKVCDAQTLSIDVFTKSDIFVEFLAKDFPTIGFVKKENPEYERAIKQILVSNGSSPIFADSAPSKIRNNLYLGSHAHARSSAMMKAIGVNLIVNCTTTIPNYHEGIEYKRFPLTDVAQDPIELYFEDACLTITDAIQKGKTVFVHCEAGISRSASIVIAYLMKSENIVFSDAFTSVRQVRPIIAPNIGFELKLRDFEKSQRENLRL